MPEASLRRRDGSAPRVLVVEDEALIALDLETTLRRHGCEVVGPVGTVGEGCRLAAAGRIDAAVLDINLGREPVFPVADALAAAAVPFLFVTGYDAGVLPARHRHRPVALKPYRVRKLIDALANLLATGA